MGTVVKMKRKPSAKSVANAKFTAIFNEAKTAADAAGQTWLVNAKPQFRVVQRANPFDDTSPIVKDFGTMLDVCGFSYVKIVDRRSGFAKWYGAKVGHDRRFVHFGLALERRQELGLQEAMTKAALDVFNKHGIKGLEFYSRID